MPRSAISLRGLTRTFGGGGGAARGAAIAALSELTLDVAEGEMLVLVGPSGCGKSTALRLIAGLDRPDAGEIRIGDRDVASVPPQERDVAMVFQGYALYPHLTVRDIIGFPLKMRGVPVKERSRRVDDAASMLGLSRLLDRRPAELSGGERQRVAMGRAIVRQPKVFLFDEPLSNLDAALRAELRVELAALVRRLGTTAVYVTHDQVEAMTMADRIAVLRAGVLQQVGAPRVIYEEPANLFVAGFLGTPPINRIELKREDRRYVAPGLCLPAPQGVERPTITAGIRPEHLRLRPAAGFGDSLDAGEERGISAPGGDSAAGGTSAAGGDSAAGDLGDAITIEATVIIAEPLGAETYLYLDAGETRLRVRAPGFETPPRGASVRLSVDARAVLWFDTETGARIELSSGTGRSAYRPPPPVRHAGEA